MSAILRDRKYYLLRGKRFEVGYYDRTRQKEQIRMTGETFSVADVRKIYERYREIFVAELVGKPDAERCWSYLTKEMKMCVVLSYYFHTVCRDTKVANMELSSTWLEEAFFREELAVSRRAFSWRNFTHMRSWVRGAFRLICKHELGIRFNNIHLVLDRVMGEDVWGIHWDVSAPLDLWSGMRHLLFDDVIRS